MATVQVRYIVHDVDAAIVFYTKQLGFSLEMHPAPPFAMLSRGDLRLVLSAPNPMGGGGQSMPDGTKPEPAVGIDSPSRSTILLPRSRACGGAEPLSQ
jgi:catechol 2,3-dioxygenase-like lactoylglutathione lyase family enzyme